MTTYDFTTRLDRSGCGSEKWNGMRKACPDVPAGTVPLSVADMEFMGAPQIAACIGRYAAENVLGYTEPTDAYFDAVRGWMRRRHDWDVPREWIVTSPGVVPALFHMVKTFTKPGDGIIVQPPVYYPFRMAVELTGRTMVENPLVLKGTRYEMDFADLERKAADPANTMMIACSPHNPVGRVWSREELERLVQICLDNDVLLVCDEIHNDLIMPGHEHVTVHNATPAEGRERVIVCTAPSKTFNLAGLQCSNIIIASEELRQRFTGAFWESNGMECLNALAYPACTCAYNECEGWLDELLGVLDGNRRLFADFMAAELPQVRVIPLEGTYLQWADFGFLGMGPKEQERFMQQDAHLFLDEGYVFGTGGAGFERFNLACPKSVLAESLERLAQAVRSRD